MGLFSNDVSEEKLEEIKLKREKLNKELELRLAIEKEEKLLEMEEKKLSLLKTPKWLKNLR